MSWKADVIEHSMCEETGIELTTFSLCYPRFVHAEFMTHRRFSRNASSSRAIPVAKMIEQVRNNPAEPVHWGANQPGMQARAELEGGALLEAQALWRHAAREAADTAESMNRLGLHKQVANRILEPFQWINVIATSTEWENFYELRDHEDADPNIAKLARMMLAASNVSTARPVSARDQNSSTGWHLPYVSKVERETFFHSPLYLAKLSTARCARVSYLTHEGKVPDPVKDVDLYDRLVGSVPIHASPTEHQARATGDVYWHKNFQGWSQYRAIVEANINR